jgi:hypothetical protein
MNPGDMTEAWSAPPELERSLPRAVRLNGMGILNCAIGLALLVVGLGLAAQAVNGELRREAESATRVRRMASEGREAVAVVTGLRNGLGYVVQYDYSVDGRTFRKNVFVTEAHWESLAVGSPLAIRYLVSDPSESYAEANPPNLQQHWAMVLPMAAVALFFMCSFAAGQLSVVWFERRLLGVGTVARGVVTHCIKSRSRRGGFVVRYEFQLADGSQGEGKEHRASQLEENSAITVLYDARRPQRSGIYPMETVSVRQE